MNNKFNPDERALFLAMCADAQNEKRPKPYMIHIFDSRHGHMELFNAAPTDRN